jgi:hypothetical protein
VWVRLLVETDPKSVWPEMARLSGVKVLEREADCGACLLCDGGDRAPREALYCMASVSDPLLLWDFLPAARSGCGGS